MKALIFAALIVGLVTIQSDVVVLASVPQSVPVPDPAVAALQRLETEWNEAHAKGDAAALDRIFAEDMVVVVPGMRPMSKADSLGVFRTGRMKFDRYESSETQVRVYGTSAVVTGRIHRARIMPDRSLEDDWRFTKVYLQKDGRWQVVSFHASNAAP
jgi:uncharacterized protein (TIGR02246 family)